MKNGYVETPAGRVMSEAIELAIEEKSPFPEQSAFIDADTPFTEQAMERAAEDGYSVVLVWPDCSTQVVAPEEIVQR